MTTSLTPLGFRPSRVQGSGYNTAGMSEYRVSNGFGGNIFYGDPVAFIGGNGGDIRPASVSTDYIVGVFMGCRYVDPTTFQPRWSRYFPAGTSSADGVIRALVVDDINTTYVAQADSTCSAGDIGLNFSMSVGTGSTLTGRSGAVLAAAMRSTAGPAMFRVIGLFDSPDNAFTDAYPLLEVRINQNAITRVSAG